MGLRTLTPQELTAARLREMARDLILEAEALEASIERPESRKDIGHISPISGRPVKYTYIGLDND